MSKTTETMTTETETKFELDLTPTWAFAVQVYLAVLDNPDASASGRMEAKEEIMRLARIVDAIKSNNDNEEPMKKPNQTQIRSIEPYMCHGEWAFDDDTTGLVQEAFVCGMSEILDFCLEDSGIDPEEVGDGFKLTFSKDKWPDSTHSLTWLGDSEGGNDYELDSECRNLTIHNSDRRYDVPEGMKGWLCPALYHYFDDAPEKIYLSVARKEK
tara:strand:+ start:440 stop:1078 length:639 start_codon:yes stop_codon:yes gene_type:complete